MPFVGPVVRAAIMIVAILVMQAPLKANAFEYKRLPLASAISKPAPDIVEQFLVRVRDGMRAGDFAAHAPQPRAQAYDGLPPKVWLLSRISKDFRCRRDFGGMCSKDCRSCKDGECPPGWIRNGSIACEAGEPGDVYRFFTHVFADTDIPALSKIAHPATDRRVAAMLEDASFDLSAFRRPFRKIDAGRYGAGRYCAAEPQAAGASDFDSIAKRFGNTLEAYEKFKGITGTWNVRAAPTTTAKIVGRVHDEIILFPNGARQQRVGHPQRGGSRSWSPVVLPDGTSGYVAATERNLLLFDIHGGACVKVVDGKVYISDHVGSGD